MRVLVTGGTGVVGRATTTELLERGHRVRLLSRNAVDDAESWSGAIEAFACDIGDAESLQGAAADCDAMVHIAGIVQESGDTGTFQEVNVDGTRRLLEECARAGVRRVVFVSSLGAERGESDYHRSKFQGEQLTREYPGEWVVVRPGAVVGPGDGTVSLLLRMVRALPVVPVIGGADQQFQPVWHEDLGVALAECLERANVVGRVLHMVGDEVLTVGELLDEFAQLTGRDPPRLPLPALFARLGGELAAQLGVDTPVSPATIQMLLEGNYLRPHERNDLRALLQADPAPIRDRLAELVHDLPEQLPEQGHGKLKRRRFQADIVGTPHDAAGIMRLVHSRFDTLMTVDAEVEGSPGSQLAEGETITIKLPARGVAQVRVEQVDANSFTLGTVDGHPLAGVVRFRADDRGEGGVRFRIDVAERAASWLDWLAMALVGSAAQRETWKSTLENVIEASGGEAPNGVEIESWDLDDDDAERLDDWIRRLVQARQRRETANGGA